VKVWQQISYGYLWWKQHLPYFHFYAIFFKKEKVSGNFIKRATTLDGNLKKKTEGKSGSLNHGPQESRLPTSNLKRGSPSLCENDISKLLAFYKT
jgi:hypothetical protein